VDIDYALPGQLVVAVFVRLGEKWREGTVQKAQDAILRILS